MNNTISVYELLGLIKDGKAPKKIEYKGDTYIYAGDDYSINDNREDWLITKYDYFLTDFLNEEVEILEEDKDENIKPLATFNDVSFYSWIYVDENRRKINELIKEVNKLRKENNNG